LHLGIHIFDVYLQSQKDHVLLDDLQVVGLTALWVASKYVEVTPLHLRELATTYSEVSTNTEKYKVAEHKILRSIDYDLSYPSPTEFFGGVGMTRHELMYAEVFVDVFLIAPTYNYDPSRFRASCIAACAIVFAKNVSPADSAHADWVDIMHVYQCTKNVVRDVVDKEYVWPLYGATPHDSPWLEACATLMQDNICLMPDITLAILKRRFHPDVCDMQIDTESALAQATPALAITPGTETPGTETPAPSPGLATLQEPAPPPPPPPAIPGISAPPPAAAPAASPAPAEAPAAPPPPAAPPAAPSPPAAAPPAAPSPIGPPPAPPAQTQTQKPAMSQQRPMRVTLSDLGVRRTTAHGNARGVTAGKAIHHKRKSEAWMHDFVH
jgi:hypothetical protein